jgi:molecular chaperone DnaK (HSP70)
MSADEDSESRVAIGISFGNSYSSIAFTSSVSCLHMDEIESVADDNTLGWKTRSYRKRRRRYVTHGYWTMSSANLHQIVKFHRFFRMSKAMNSKALKQRHNSFATQKTLWHTFVIILERSMLYDVTWNNTYRHSFQSIDPTPSHQSAHPIKHDETIAFSIHDKEDTEAEASTVTVSTIASRHISRLVQSATDFIGQTVTSAVITVPTNFTAAQKTALATACKDAKLEVLQLIHEPVAALLAYDARDSEAHPADKIVVVADLGGIRSDVAVIASRGGMYTTIATSHDYDVGGTALDAVLIEYFAKEFLKKHKSATDPRSTPKSLAKLTLEAEAVKKALSLGSSANFSVESLSDGIDFQCTINRTRFDLLASKTFAAIVRLVVSTVTDKAGLDVLDVNEVVLSGGTSHVPRAASNVAGAFPQSIVWAPSTRPKDSINPSELAARGAAIQASLISDFEAEDIEESSHPVVTATAHTSAALGIVTITADGDKGVFVPIIEKDTPVPARRTKLFGVPGAGGDVLIRLAEGSSEITVKTVERKKEEKTESEEEDSDEDEDEDEEIREKKWVVGKTIAEAAIKGTKKGAKVEVQLNIGTDFAVTLVARQVGAHGGVRGVVPADGSKENGSA